jgi:hypothetical protein
MGTTVIDPGDGASYDLVLEGRRWAIRETGTGREPVGLNGRGPWGTPEQALAALRQLCSGKGGSDRPPRGPGPFDAAQAREH